MLLLRVKQRCKWRTVKVDGAGSILVDFLDDADQLLGSQPRVQLVQDLLQGLCGDVAVA